MVAGGYTAMIVSGTTETLQTIGPTPCKSGKSGTSDKSEKSAKSKKPAKSKKSDKSAKVLLLG